MCNILSELSFYIRECTHRIFYHIMQETGLNTDEIWLQIEQYFGSENGVNDVWIATFSHLSLMCVTCIDIRTPYHFIYFFRRYICHVYLYWRYDPHTHYGVYIVVQRWSCFFRHGSVDG